MEIDNLPDHLVYSPQVIDFVTVAAETCLMFEHATEHTREDFVTKSLGLLSALYLKSVLLHAPERVYEDLTERFVTEIDYNEVKQTVEQLMGEKDSYLETFHPDMALSDTPIAAFVSENLADVYQELKDFLANYQLADTEVMNDALSDCLIAFAEHWGQKLLNALRALHAVRYSDDFGAEELELSEPHVKVDRNAFLGFVRDDDKIENLLL
jgi:hypothetical protein